MSEQKTITRDAYLQALGLFTLARAASVKTDEFNDALMRHLGIERNGHLMDAVYCGDRDFDAALALEGIIVGITSDAEK